MKTQLANQILYEQDYYLWLETTFQQLQEYTKNRNLENFNKVDWKNLLEEIQDLGQAQKNKVNSYLKQILIHLLLYSYWQAELPYCRNGWRVEIRNFRDELELNLSTTLAHYLRQELAKIYSKARKIAIDKTGLSPETFPLECPFTWEQILDSEYFPE